MMKQKVSEKGLLLVITLVFGSIFLTVVVSFLGFVVTQSKMLEHRLTQEKALSVAEAGLDYYKWYLAHNPDDATHGTGLAGPYVEPYIDASATTVGEFSLEISSTTYCGVVSSIDIVSTGYTTDSPSNTRTVYGKYARPTVAEYAYIINSDVWAGADRTIVGPYYSNGHIRMDGTNNSTVASGQEDWVCDGSFSCSPNGGTIDAVFGDGPNFALWDFPSDPINFTGLTVDLALMKDRAELGGGVYIANSGVFGYRVEYQEDNTIDVYPVTDTESYTASNSEGDHTEENVILTEGLPTTYALDPSCPLVYIEDKVWLHGTTSMRTSLAVADLNIGGSDPSIILHDQLVYNGDDAGLLAVAEEDVLIGLVVPDDMFLNGIFVAQGGRFGRNHYTEANLPRICTGWWWWFCTGWDEPYAEFVTRNSLTINGTIVSNGRVGTRWTSGGVFVSGFGTRFNSYDRDLVENPPPLAPRTSDDYKFIEWREVD